MTEEMNARWNEPMTDKEIRDLLSATLHGPLPKETIWRLLTTVAELPVIRARLNVLELSLEVTRKENIKLNERTTKDRKMWQSCLRDLQDKLRESKNHRKLVQAALSKAQDACKRAEHERDTALTELKDASILLKDFHDNWDCDSDSHKYHNPCRSCVSGDFLNRITRSNAIQTLLDELEGK